MARRCCVPSCGADVGEARARGLPLHKLPRDAALRSRWLASGGFGAEFAPAAGQLVCHRHFRRADYETTGSKFLLRRGTVPTVFADYDNHPDPVNIFMKAVSYTQEDIDLMNMDISNLDGSALEAEMQSDAENSENAENKDKNVLPDSKDKQINKADLSFSPGSKLEAKDFNEKWYSAKIVETDWEEGEVLIHFDKWSSRYDEWIPMDSPRLRTLQVQPSEQPWMLSSPDVRPKEFSTGERVLATWADGRRYPAKISAVLGNDRYHVLFDDGYHKIVKSSKMTKIAATSDKTSEEDSYIGSKQERRDKKRKHTVMELFQHSRKRAKLEGDARKREGAKDGSKFLASDVMDVSVGEISTNPDLASPDAAHAQKVRSHQKRSRRDYIRSDTDYEDDPPEWINGEPQGTEAYIVEGSDGPRRSIIVPDKRLPEGWQKHFTQRRTGSSAGKWDVFFVHDSSGKKFRSRNEIKTYLEYQGQADLYDPERFDFCIHRKKKPVTHKSADVKKIKTLLPKVKSISGTPEAASTVPVLTSPLMPITPADDNAVFIGGLRVEMEDSAYKCPKEGCKEKSFRKENLLQMHIKHYHPEYSKFLGTTPNVADLAYARTIGESIDDIIPKKTVTLAERLGKVDKSRKVDKLPLLQPAPSPLTSHSPRSGQPSPTPPALEPEIERGTSAAAFADIRAELAMVDANDSATSPGAFDLKSRDPGLRQQLAVRDRLDKARSLDDPPADKGAKDGRRRHFSDHGGDFSNKMKKRRNVSDIPDDFGSLDDSTLDTDKSSFSYRFSRKSDTKSDENSENSQLNESRFDKGDTPKGDATKRDSNIDAEEEGVMMMINGEMVKLERLRREEIINCVCGVMEEDGLMIQCDVCLCWQHGLCNAIEREKDVPEKYICYICRNPYRQRPSKKYAHDQEWIKEGKLPSLMTPLRNQEKDDKRQAMLKRSYALTGSLQDIIKLQHSLRVKINVAKTKDHPKLYLWAKDWEKPEIPEPDVEPVPVYEYLKTPPNAVDTNSEVSQTEEVKFDLSRSIKDDVDGKSIASDTELMKILEEDSLHSDESKFTTKNEELDVQNNILLDALTKNENNTDMNQTSEVKNENESSNQSMSMPNTPQPEEPPHQIIEMDAPAPIQPFIPEPEAPIDPEECRIRLLDHICHYQNYINAQLTAIEAQVSVLEQMESTIGEDSRAKQTVQMLLRDVSTVRKFAALS